MPCWAIPFEIIILDAVVLARRRSSMSGHGRVWIVFALLLALSGGAQASECLATAESPAGVIRTVAAPSQLTERQVSITYIGHSTFLIESAGGVTIATDYAGYAGPGVVPRIVTMNRAHQTHYTDSPDPRIEHVLRGWNPDGGAAQHNLTSGDVVIRNVPTDIRSWSGARIVDGNSIFIFEIARMCIGHLGHLHHELTPELLGLIGRLDIVLVPVDGSYTMSQESMIEVIKQLRARLVIPMHFFGPATLARFLSALGEAFTIETNPTSQIVVSSDDLPARPKVLVLPGE
jgi:L-ascorbate metabolism protein UlaG (beta-lactamase superfamily)